MPMLMNTLECLKSMRLVIHRTGLRVVMLTPKIVAEVQHEMAVARGDVIELEDSEDDAEDDEDLPTRGEVIKLCKKVCLDYGDVDFSLELPHQLHRYRAKLLQAALLDSKQTSLDSYFTQRSSGMVDTE